MMRRAAALLAFGLALSSAAQTPLVPVTYRSHFQPNPGADPSSGSRDGWESYPITEETGYEPTLMPETSQKMSWLVREAAPTQDGDLRLGFIRRMHLVAGCFHLPR